MMATLPRSPTEARPVGCAWSAGPLCVTDVIAHCALPRRLPGHTAAAL